MFRGRPISVGATEFSASPSGAVITDLKRAAARLDAQIAAASDDLPRAAMARIASDTPAIVARGQSARSVGSRFIEGRVLRRLTRARIA